MFNDNGSRVANSLRAFEFVGLGNIYIYFTAVFCVTSLQEINKQ